MAPPCSVFQEVLPGKLLADQLYRCPDRYLFDEDTRRCQRQHTVTCRKFTFSRDEQRSDFWVSLVIDLTKFRIE